MKRAILAVLAGIMILTGGAAVAQADDYTGWAGQIDLSGPSECQIPGTEEVTITATNPDPVTIWFTIKGDTGFYVGSQKLAAGASREYAVPYEPGAEYTIGNAGTHPDPGTVALPPECVKEYTGCEPVFSGTDQHGRTWNFGCRVTWEWVEPPRFEPKTFTYSFRVAR